MKAIPTSRGGSQAAYLWKEASGILETPDAWVARSELDLAVEEGADYEELVEIAYSERLARVRAAIQLDHHQALHGLDGIDHELLWDKAADDASAALQRYDDAQNSPRLIGIQYRHDTSPELAALLKLDPTATPQLDELKHLLSCLATDGTAIPGKKQSATLGSLELELSPGKSVSVVYGLSTPEERLAIVRAQQTAVDRAMHQLAGKIGFLRNRRDGLDRRDPADLTWVQWQHHMSRRGDPQLHTHVSLINVVRSRVDGRVGTMDTFLLHGFYHTVWETYHRTLVGELCKLGLQASYDAKAHAAVLTDVPAPVLRHFSGRTADAERWLQEKLGPSLASLTPHQRSTWLGHAAAKTRPPKPQLAEPADTWKARAATHGYASPTRLIDPKKEGHQPERSIQSSRHGHYTPPPRFDDRADRGASAPSQAKNNSRAPWRFAYDDLAHKHGRSL